MPKRSAGILMFRQGGRGLEVLLVHPGGPFWAKKDIGAWSVPKGEYPDHEDPLTAAVREFAEETGSCPKGVFIPLGELRQPGRKLVTVWALKGEFDIEALKSNLFEMEWPPRSGRKAFFPEIDRAQWFSLTEARRRILPGQREFIDRLAQAAAHGARSQPGR
jgi:predicted NUDIX family NTP pyrophosphohydrolase